MKNSVHILASGMLVLAGFSAVAAEQTQVASQSASIHFMADADLAKIQAGKLSYAKKLSDSALNAYLAARKDAAQSTGDSAVKAALSQIANKNGIPLAKLTDAALKKETARLNAATQLKATQAAVRKAASTKN
ncbi:MAG: hypothetical protein HC848_05620 [Limnobacter sp.]|nr:hypothetical protein [Limnobacter sp.]